ncbi:enoyl-CoA hydratase [Streptomyces rapamycinicus]|uniref:Enoyl-CoA hydratase n=1 Tax=Streptomyces rhizosphaericus TaxID=114699 RepID=A0A6G4A7D8_9ACTN|nr:enoyl-CoA hydratase [Streptomyces rhizosphaericus]
MGSNRPARESSDEVVLVRREHAIAVVTLNRPHALNAVTLDMATSYARLLRTLDADPQVRAIVVTGAGRGFCSGADLEVLNQGAEAIRSFVPAEQDLPDLALRLTKPVIVAVNGPVAGIGFAYMLGSDIRYAARDARISTTFPRMGLVAEYGLSWLLPRLIGTPWALDLLLSGRTLDADEAARIGLVHHVTEPGEVLTAALAHAKDLVTHCAPSSLAAIKSQVYGDLDRTWEAALANTLHLMDNSFVGADFAEALDARSKNRAPVFRTPE